MNIACLSKCQIILYIYLHSEQVLLRAGSDDFCCLFSSLLTMPLNFPFNFNNQKLNFMSLAKSFIFLKSHINFWSTHFEPQHFDNQHPKLSSKSYLLIKNVLLLFSEPNCKERVNDNRNLSLKLNQTFVNNNRSFS